MPQEMTISIVIAAILIVSAIITQEHVTPKIKDTYRNGSNVLLTTIVANFNPA